MDIKLVDARTDVSKSADLSKNLQTCLEEKEIELEELRSDFLLMENDLQTRKKTILQQNKTLENHREKWAQLERQERDMAFTNATNSTFEKLLDELTEIKKENITLSETLRTTHQKHLLELAKSRETARVLEGMLDDSKNRMVELEAIINEDSSCNKSQESSNKRMRT
jgi:hypothetical protein